MITEEQVRQWILQKLYNQGLKYLFIDSYDWEPMASEIPPEVSSLGHASVDCDAERQKKVLLEDFITFNKPYIDIEQELGIVDWSKVPVDTPVVVWDNDDFKKYNRYFAKYEHGRVFTWHGGATSWSSNEGGTYSWDNVRLVDADKM